MNIKLNCLLLMVLFNLSVVAQNKSLSVHPVKSLQIGDTVPDVPLGKIVVVDGTLKSGRLTDYKDRLLILDFMYTGCTACIGGLPKKDHLQRQFGSKIKIMVVVGGEIYAPGMIKRENESIIRKFLTNKKSFLSRNKVQIPWVVENKLLNEYFPHQLVSHLVWIYKGKLVAVTEQDYVTEENIQMILDGKKNNWPVKNDFMPPVDERTPLIKQKISRFTGSEPLWRYAGVYGCYQNGVLTKTGTIKDSINQMRRDYIINLSLVNVYLTRWNMATGNARLTEPSSVILEVKDPTKYVRQEDSKEFNIISRNKTYICYEASGPDTGQTSQQIARAVIADLDQLLGLHGRFEKRKLKCLSLVRTDSIDRLRSIVKDGEGFTEFKIPNIQLRNRSLSNLTWQLNQFYGNPPVFDETKYSGTVDMDLKISSWRDIPSVRKAFQAYGLDLKEEERELEVFVLTEKDIKSSPKINL